MAQIIPLCFSTFVTCPSICDFGLYLDFSLPVPLCVITYHLSLCLASLIHFVLTLRHLVVLRQFWTSPSGPREAVLFLFRFLYSGRSPTRPVHLYPRRPCYTNLRPLVLHRLLTPPIIVGGLTAMVEGQRVPPWQAWGLSVLSATSHAKSPSKFGLPALFLNQPLAVVLGLLGLLVPRPSGLPSLRVLRDHWAMSPSRPEVWQPAIPLILFPP